MISDSYPMADSQKSLIKGISFLLKNNSSFKEDSDGLLVSFVAAARFLISKNELDELSVAYSTLPEEDLVMQTAINFGESLRAKTQRCCIYSARSVIASVSTYFVVQGRDLVKELESSVSQEVELCA